MKWGAAIGTLVGLALESWLLASYGVAEVLGLLQRAGWGIALVVVFHFVQILFSALAWRAVAGPMGPQPTLGEYIARRWIRKGINNLLPVAQIGGEVVAARLLRRRGVPLTAAVAGSVGDLTMEMLTQILFTLIGLGLLVLLVGESSVGGYILDDAIRALYRAPSRMAWACTHHSISWLLGGIEVCLALHFLGTDVGFGEGLVIKALGQALKAAGFAIPGAIGVAEGGYVVVCHLFGLAPVAAAVGEDVARATGARVAAALHGEDDPAEPKSAPAGLRMTQASADGMDLPRAAGAALVLGAAAILLRQQHEKAVKRAMPGSAAAAVPPPSMMEAPPQDATKADGAKAPGKPGTAEGFRDPKGGESWVPNPNGNGSGWQDANGDVWVPTGLEQDVEFIGDALARLGSEALDRALEQVWTRPVRKPDAIGIHGTLFYELEQKRRFYPSRSESDVAGPPNAPAR